MASLVIPVLMDKREIEVQKAMLVELVYLVTTVYPEDLVVMVFPA